MIYFFDVDKAKKKDTFSNWRVKLHEVIFEADTRAGKIFDLLLIASITLSVIIVMLESVASIKAEYGETLFILEWFFTILFTIEYILRLICIGRPLLYATSFLGLVDLAAIIPTYLDLFLPGTHFLVVIRILRVLRIFRILKLFQYVGESRLLLEALHASRRKIEVFLYGVLTLAIIFGSTMYVIEGESAGFTSIPRSIYWAIVTLTTVGYGDISPKTALGQTVSAAIMVLGYAIIAVPTGIVTAELSKHTKMEKTNTQVCQECHADDHDNDAHYCKHCGTSLDKTH